MNERELLEMAAKAAGIALVHKPFVHNGLAGAALTEHGYWNPLTDDGDALRLAVKLRLQLVIMAKFASAVPTTGGICGCDEYITDDTCTATRRAIVRAAAHIGKAMP